MSDFLNCRKNTENKNPKFVRTKNGIIMRLSKCAVCDSKISKFVKGQEASGLLSSLEIKSFKYNSYIRFSFVLLLAGENVCL